MTNAVLQFLLLHWKPVLGVWIGLNVINGMPSPNGVGIRATTWYKWLFSTLHGIGGMVPRIIATVFPQIGNFFNPPTGGQGSGPTQ
jgi:hypothetical protein